MIFFPLKQEFGRQANADGRHNVPEVHSTSALPNNLKAGSSSTQSSSEVALQGKSLMHEI